MLPLHETQPTYPSMAKETHPSLTRTTLFPVEVRIAATPPKPKNSNGVSRGFNLPESVSVCLRSVRCREAPIFCRFAESRGRPRGSGSRQVVGKRAMPWCRDTRLDESDGRAFVVRYADSPNIHRRPSIVIGSCSARRPAVRSAKRPSRTWSRSPVPRGNPNRSRTNYCKSTRHRNMKRLMKMSGLTPDVRDDRFYEPDRSTSMGFFYNDHEPRVGVSQSV